MTSDQPASRLMYDERGGLGADFLAFVATVLMVYGAFWVFYEFFYPLDESILFDVVLAIRSPFIEVFGPTRGSTVFLLLVLVVGILLNVAVYMIDEQSTTEIAENGGKEDI